MYDLGLLIAYYSRPCHVFKTRAGIEKSHKQKQKKKPSAHRRTMGDESWHVGLALYKNLFHYRTLSPNVTLFNKN